MQIWVSQYFLAEIDFAGLAVPPQGTLNMRREPSCRNTQGVKDSLLQRLSHNFSTNLSRTQGSGRDHAGPVVS